MSSHGSKGKGNGTAPRKTLPVTLRHAGVYADRIQKRLKEQNETNPVVPLPPHVIGGIRDIVVRTKQCNCKRSNCLKLYCECFTAGIHCSVLCHCVDCKNDGASKINDEMRTRSLTSIIDRNPNAFRPKLTAGLGGGSEEVNIDFVTQSTNVDSRSSKEGVTQGSRTRGCNCKKSFCLKKYCECFQATVYCSITVCKCLDCRNVEGNERRESLIKKIIKNTNEQTMQSSAQGGLIASSADMFLPPSTYAVPLHFEGAEAPAISFGTSGGSRVEMMVSRPIKVENLPKQSTEPIKLEQLRDQNNNVIETDLERKSRIVGMEMATLLDSIRDSIQSKVGIKDSVPKKRAASEISSNILSNIRSIVHGIKETKKDKQSNEQITSTVLKSPTKISEDIATPLEILDSSKINFECTETMNSILPITNITPEEDIMITKQNIILRRLAASIKVTASRLAEKRRQKNQKEN